MEPLLSDDQKVKRKKFANWLRTNFGEEDTMKILFSDEKYFDIDSVDEFSERLSVGSQSC